MLNQKPHNVDAEEATLGSLLIDPDRIILVDALLDPPDFYIERHNWIYQSMLDLYNEGVTIDMVTLSDRLEQQGLLDEIGGAAYLTQLMNSTPTALNAEWHAGIVHRTAWLRRIIGGAEKIVEMAYADKANAEDVAEEFDRIAFESRPRKGRRREKTFRQLLSEAQEKQAKLDLIDEMLGISTGLLNLNKLLGGWNETDMIVLAGRPGMGKTSLAIQFAMTAIISEKKQVAIFSMEMSDEQITNKAIASTGQFDSALLRQPKGLTRSDKWQEFFGAVRTLDEVAGNLTIIDTPALKPSELRARARRVQAEEGLDLLIVDYLQLMRGDGQNRTEQITHTSGALKALAKELHVPVIALSQLSRAVEGRTDKRPLLSDLRESGSIEQDADIVIFLYRDDYYNPDTEFPNLAEMDVSKHRHGPTGNLSVYFKRKEGRFIDLQVRVQSLEAAV